MKVPDGARFVRDSSEPYGTTADLTFDSFDGGGPFYRVLVDDFSIVTYTADVRYRDENHAELDGAAFDYIYTFVGLRPGTARITVTSDMQGEKEQYLYTATVDENLNVTIQELTEEGSDASPEGE